MEDIVKAIHQVNLDIEGMLRSGDESEKALKRLNDAREYRKMLEDDLQLAVRNSKPKGFIMVGFVVLN